MSKEDRSYEKRDILTPEPLTGRKVAELVEELFEKYSPELRSHLVDSNVVLTLAGLKPQTEFFVDVNDEKGDKELENEIKSLSEAVKQSCPEIRFRIVGKPITQPPNSQKALEKRTQMISLENLRGYERQSKLTEIPGIKPFDADTGWDGWKEWYQNITIEFRKAVNFDQLSPNEQEFSLSVFSGFRKGYPDFACYDFADWLRNERKIKMANSRIPFAGLYDEAQPNYDFRPEHASDPSITKNISMAGKILKEFYGSSFHKKIESGLSSHKNRYALDENGHRIVR